MLLLPMPSALCTEPENLIPQNPKPYKPQTSKPLNPKPEDTESKNPKPLNPKREPYVPLGSYVVPFWDYLIGV